MATGIPLAPRHVPRFRLPWRYAGVFSRYALVLKGGIARVISVTRVLWKRLANGAREILGLRGRARQRNHARFNVFEHKYEGLVDLLCTAAHQGVQREHEAAYKRSRMWMMVHYPKIAKHLQTYWAASDGLTPDPFLALFSFPHLVQAVNAESGIDDIMRARAALDAYKADFNTAK